MASFDFDPVIAGRQQHDPVIEPGKPVVVRMGDNEYRGYVHAINLGYSDGDSMREMDVRINLDRTTVARAVSNAALKQYDNAPTRKEQDMNKFEAEIIHVPESKKVNIYMREVATGKYLTMDGDLIDRAPGTEMPIYMTMADEFFQPILAAAKRG